MAAKTKYIQVRVSENEDKMVDALAQTYGVDKSQLVLLALTYVNKKRPSFAIEPQGKVFAPAAVAASLANTN